MRDHFPFWRPFLTAVLMAGVFAAWNWSVVHVASGYFEGAAHQQQECRVVADLAKASLPEFEGINTARAKRGLLPVVIGANPKLWTHVTREGSQAIFPASVPVGLRNLVVLVPPLDCTGAFQTAGVPIVRRATPWDESGTHTIEIVFSRVVFSPDGREAYVERGHLCGGNCGQGFDTVRQLQDDRWVLTRSHQTWIS